MDHEPMPVAASIGVAVAPSGTVDAHTLLKRADAAMYRAKRTGARVVWDSADARNSPAPLAVG